MELNHRQIALLGYALRHPDQRYTVKSHASSHKIGDKAGRAYALTNLTDAAHERGDKERATALYEEALALQRELGNERGAARALARLTTSR